MSQIFFFGQNSVGQDAEIKRAEPVNLARHKYLSTSKVLMYSKEPPAGASQLSHEKN